MRLTVRTLLAWIDGVLPGPQQEEIGAKVGASAVAPRLVERIRDVTTRPGIAAPRVDGRGLAEDANTVAEFLDNALAADRLEAFERVCIESDIHLAEAADCHALLAELARDPAVIEPADRRLRQRLLERVAADVGPTPQKPHEEAAALARAVRQAVDRQAVEERTPRGGLSLVAWLSAGLALLLLVALAGLLGWSLRGTAKPTREVAASPAADAASRLPGAVPAARDAAAQDEPGLASAPDAAAPVPGPRVDRPPPAAAGAANAAGAPEATAAAPVAAAPDHEPPGGAGAIAAPNDPSPAADVSGAAPTDAAAAAIGAGLPPPPGEPADEPAPLADEERPAAPPGMVAEGGPVLHRVKDGDAIHWERLAAGDPLNAEEDLVAPEHAYPRLIRGEVSFRLQPRTQAALTTDRDGTPRLEVVFGAAVAWTEAAEGAVVGITAGGLSGVARLGPRQPLGVAVELMRNEGDDPADVPASRRARVHVTGGSSWRQTEMDGGPVGQPLAGLDVEQPLPPRVGMEWDSTDPVAARLLPAAGIPDWMQRTSPAGRLDRNAGAELAARLAAHAPVEESLRTMAADRRVENRMAAAATLALLGDYDELVGLLCEDRPGEKLSERQWSDLEAATVPLALERGANAAAKLRGSFAARGPAGRGDELFALARGLSPAERAEGGPAALVALLSDDSLAVRRYAFKALAATFPDETAGRLDYRPDRSPLLNERGVERWRRKVAEAGAEPGPEPAP